MQHSKEINRYVLMDALPGQAFFPVGGFRLLVAMGLIVLAFIPLVPPVDVLQGGTTTRGFIEFGLILCGLALLAIYLKAQGAFSFDVRSPVFLLISMFTFWAVVSSIWSPNPLLTIVKSAELWCIAVGAMMCVTVAARSHLSNGRLETILGLSIVAVVCGLVIANLYIWGVPLPTSGDQSLPLEIIGEEVSDERPRLILAYQHPLLSADLLALGVISLFVSNLRNTWKGLLISVLLALFWLTGARGATVALLTAMVALFFLKLRRNDVRAIAVMLVISVALGAALFFQHRLPGDVASLMNDDVSTLNSRTALWAKVVSHIVAQPILGTGYFASRYLLIKDFDWGGHAHNSFLEVLMTTGVIGLMMLCGFVVYLFRSLFRSRNALLLGATIYCLIQGMVNPLLFYPGLAMFVITVAVLNAELSTVGSSQPQWRSGADDSDTGRNPLALRDVALDSVGSTGPFSSRAQKGPAPSSASVE